MPSTITDKKKRIFKSLRINCFLRSIVIQIKQTIANSPPSIKMILISQLIEVNSVQASDKFFPESSHWTIPY